MSSTCDQYSQLSTSAFSHGTVVDYDTVVIYMKTISVELSYL